MPQLLLEILSEEIPARMQAKAEADFAKALTGALAEAGLSFGEVTSWSGPRRLGLVVEGLEAKARDVSEERKGPKVGAPEQAVAGFLRSAGLASIEEAEIVSDPKKGDFYVAKISKPGRLATEVVASAVPALMADFPWPKSMTSGYGTLRWVRPLQRIVCLFDGAVVPFEVDGIAPGDVTEGHRVHGAGPFTVTGLADYRGQLEGAGHVVLDREARKAKIAADAAKVCAAKGLELVEDIGLLDEVTGLAEWPVVILGDMDPAFLDLPPEVIRLSMRVHQKYFAVRDPKSGGLAPHFVVVANLEALDGGAAIAAGNSRVLSARLNDARFFWDGDRKVGLEAMAPKLARIAFKEELGSIADKVERVASLARELAPKVGADPDLAEKAAKLCKADLVSGMVGEFPELQGVMGRYYALDAGEDAAVADAIADHYRPQGPSDAVPTAPVSIAVALADKLDTLVGFWAIGEEPTSQEDIESSTLGADLSTQMVEKPTGSKDPFALRRAALGIVRIVLENAVRLPLQSVVNHQFELVGLNLPAYYCVGDDIVLEGRGKDVPRFRDMMLALVRDQAATGSALGGWPTVHHSLRPIDGVPADLLSFFADRLKVHLKEQGIRHDLIDAVFALGEDDLVLITKRVEALQAFLGAESGAALLAGYRRAANILKAEEKKEGAPITGVVNESLLTSDEERALFAQIDTATAQSDAAMQHEEFSRAMGALSELRAPVDQFFEKTVVNADDPDIRLNRLRLLTLIRDALHRVADFSRIEG